MRLQSHLTGAVSSTSLQSFRLWHDVVSLLIDAMGHATAPSVIAPHVLLQYKFV